jgi:hypothetical protein
MKRKSQIIFAIAVLAVFLVVSGCSHSETKDHSEHQSHLDKVNQQGDKAMGFSHQKTKHKFILLKDGGAIQVKANDAKDTTSIEQIRKHLSQLPKMFSAGNFEDPLATHGRIPPGVPDMKRLKREIDYKFEEVERGGRVRISTENKEALKAVHDFLRFQIEDHQTGDSVEIQNIELDN